MPSGMVPHSGCGTESTHPHKQQQRAPLLKPSRGAGTKLAGPSAPKRTSQPRTPDLQLRPSSASYMLQC